MPTPSDFQRDASDDQKPIAVITGMHGFTRFVARTIEDADPHRI